MAMHKENRDIIFDLYLWFYSDSSVEYDQIQNQLTFSLVPTSENPKINSGSAQFDFESDYAEDEPGWVAPLSEIGDSEVLWTWGNEKRWACNRESLDEYRSEAQNEPWLFFSRISLSVDIEYQWDFDIEEGFEQFTESIVRPIFESISLDVTSLRATEYVLQAYEL